MENPDLFKNESASLLSKHFHNQRFFNSAFETKLLFGISRTNLSPKSSLVCFLHGISQFIQRIVAVNGFWIFL